MRASYHFPLVFLMYPRQVWGVTQEDDDGNSLRVMDGGCSEGLLPK